MFAEQKAISVYEAFGLNIASEIRFLDMTPVQGAPDLVIEDGKVPEKIPNAKVKGVRYEAGPGEFLLKVDGVAGYYVRGGQSIVVEREAGAADEEVLLFLMGSAMGALLHQRSIVSLHAGAVSVDGGAVLFAGPSSIGKSTLAAALQQQGYPILADDVCCFNRWDGPRQGNTGLSPAQALGRCPQEARDPKERAQTGPAGPGFQEIFCSVCQCKPPAGAGPFGFYPQ